jgi:anti-sigma factor RsiW
MNCEEIEKNLVAYLDIKAQPSERRQVETHLSECAACRERAEGFRLVWGLLDELPMVSPSPAFDAGVRARVAQEPRAGLWTWAVPSPRLALAGFALVMLSLWLSSFPPARQPVVAVTAQAQGSEAEFRMIKDLPVLEDFDVLANFDALSDLPVAPQAMPERSDQPQM